MCHYREGGSSETMLACSRQKVVRKELETFHSCLRLELRPLTDQTILNTNVLAEKPVASPRPMSLF